MILAVVLAIVALLVAIAGVIYLTKTAQALPSILGAEPHTRATTPSAESARSSSPSHCS